MEIWAGDTYKNFRKAYHNRLNLTREIYSDLQLGTGSYEKLKKAGKAVERILAEDPLPEVCRTCYKAYNI